MLIETMPTQSAADAQPLRASGALDAATFRGIRRRMMLEGCKWDPQVGDTGTLADFALLLAPGMWPQLAGMAEQLARETLATEAELLRRPELHAKIGVPRAIRKFLAPTSSNALPGARIMRFDFHWTTDGWRISEVNADVPGGFTEASNFTASMAAHLHDYVATGDPASAWLNCIAGTAKHGGRIGLIWAPGFMEDFQIVSYLAQRLEREHGCITHLLGPQQVRWCNGMPHVVTPNGEAPLDAVVRFYQAEWLSRLPRRIGWHHFFRNSTSGGSGGVPLLNPGCAIISESKRLPLVWDELRCDVSTWRRLLPETRDPRPRPRNAPWRTSDAWLLKTAYSNNGDSVTQRSIVPRKQWRRTTLDMMFHRNTWLAQRRFETVAVPTPRGPMYPCLGVYVIDGRATGIYGRISSKPVIDYQAIDVAVLMPASDRNGGSA